MDDIASALTGSVAKNGETTMTADLPMGGYTLTGLGAGAASGESIRYEQVATSAALATLVTDETGSGALVFATSPTLVTPVLGTPASGDISNCTGSPTLTAPDLGTPSACVGTNISGTAASLNIGGNAATATKSGLPQNSQSTAYTCVAADANKHLLHPTADDNPRTFTIPANSSVAYDVGTILVFVNQINTLTIAITDDTLTLAGVGSTGSRTLAANSIAAALKIASTEWIISGTGIS